MAGIGLLLGPGRGLVAGRRVRARAAPDRSRPRDRADPSVNVVQSSFPEQLQGEISGCRAASPNLGSSFGTAIAGTILVSDLASGNTSYVLAMAALGVLALIGLAAAARLPRTAAAG